MDWGVRRPPPPQWDWDDHPTPLDPRKLPGSPPPEFWAAEDGALWSPGNLGRCAASPSNVPAGRGVEESSGGSSEVVVSVCSGSEEPPPIGLKLGRRTYFGDPDGLSDEAGRKKKGRGTQDAVRCQVEGCDLDLTGAKEYHRKHKVCDGHSKSPRVVVAGRERRFCQQCSRFHDLSEFDQKKRSCRRRLSDHNARRRKPPPEMISFSSARSYTSFYDGAHQMNFLCNRSSFSYPGSNAAAILRGSSSGLRLQEPRELSSGLRKPDNACFGQRWVSADELSSSFPTFEHGLDKFFPPKVFSTEIVSEGTTTSAVASKFNGVPDTQCALSLLSNDSRGLGCPEHPSVLNHIVHTNNSSVIFTAIPENSDNWIAEFPSGHDGRKIPVTFYSSSSQHEGFQLPKSAHDATPFDPCHIHLFE